MRSKYKLGFFICDKTDVLYNKELSLNRNLEIK